MKFEKYQGIGNDFIILENDISSEKVRKLCDRHYGIGADGVIVRKTKNNIPFMEIYNQDGSLASMCGNGIRCFAAYLEKKGIDYSSIDTQSGIKKIKKNDNRYTVDMGIAKLQFENRKLIDDIEFDSVFTGCFHLVLFDYENKYGIEFLEKYSYILEENEKLFPQGTNVNILKLIDRKNIQILTHERGVGITLACGTGASACAYMAYKKGMVDKKVNVKLLGGTLEIEIDNNRVYMTGEAKYIYKGEVE